MTLESIELEGLGRFTERKCGFRVERYHLEEPWPYIYASKQILLRVDQRGPDYVQFAPPAGSVLFRRERHQSVPSCFLWIKTGDGRAFSSFYLPAVGYNAHCEPDEFSCEFSPEKACYRVAEEGIACETTLFVPQDEPAVVMTYCVRNESRDKRCLDLVPVIRPHFAASSLAPWDVPALYQRIGYSNEDIHIFDMELRSPAGIPEAREYAFVLSNIRQPDAVEMDYGRFVGRGTFENPEALIGSSMTVDPAVTYRFGEYSPANSVNGTQGVVAFRKRVALDPGESFEFTMVMGSAGFGSRPRREDVLEFAQHLELDHRTVAIAAVRDEIESFLGIRQINTPDKALDRYVNEWLPLQLRWVRTLDRGWPTGMRGVRDCAQDTTALVPLDPYACRKTILELFGIQRRDGWFPRQYSTQGRNGKHDLRNYVDGGVWVWELLFDYLCQTKDLELLRESVSWLDSDEEGSVLDHALQLLNFYVRGENLGEHGLCLIREGDWNDSVNRAGLEGRGESVMVSCQVVMALRQMSELLLYVGGNSTEREQFVRHAELLQSNILHHALNDEGYLNGVFTDNGDWVFSPRDPDGKKRINGPVNSFGIISGVLRDEQGQRVLDILKGTKQRDGWPLFYPPIGDPPISKLGRIGAGDLSAGLGENGTMYNHGCHGFLGRAAGVLGDGDLLAEILKYMLPYDQQAHPVSRSKTAPYGIVNHWKTAPGLEGRGGDCFLTGSISTALRNVYGGLFGIKPTLCGLALRPALPSQWRQCSVRFPYLGADVEVIYVQEEGDDRIFVNGKPIDEKHRDSVTGQDWPMIPDTVFEAGKRVEIRCEIRTRD